mgnify:CR=1 FL=1
MVFSRAMTRASGESNSRDGDLNQALEIGRFEFHPDRGIILDDRGHPHRLQPKLVELLGLLARNPGKTLDRRHILDVLWQDRIVNEEALTRNIAELRNILGDSSRNPAYIETIPKKGYRLIAKVRPVENARPTLATRFGRTRGMALLAIVAIALVALAALVVPMPGADQPVRPPQNQDPLSVAARMTASAEFDIHPALSGDGRWIAYSRASAQGYHVIVSPVSDPSQQWKFSSEGDLVSPTFDPRGGFFAAAEVRGELNCRILLFPITGSESRPLGPCHRPDEAAILDFSPDGRQLAYVDLDRRTGSASIWLMSLDTLERTKLTVPSDHYRFHTQPRFSPDGQSLSFQTGTRAVRNLAVLKLSDPTEIRQLEDTAQYITGHDWSSDARTIVFDSDRSGFRALWSIAMDSGDLSLLGARDAQFPTIASETGQMAFQIAQFEANIWKISLNEPEQSASVLIRSSKYDSNPSFAPDGRTIGFTSNRSGTGAIWTFDMETGNVQRVFEPENGRVIGPHWSPDARYMLATWYQRNGQRIVRVDSVSGSLQVMPTSGGRPFNATYSSDGRFIYYIASTAGEGTQLRRMSSDGQQESVLGLAAISNFQLRGNTVYFVRDRQDGLYAADLVDGVGVTEPIAILPGLPAQAWNAWWVHGDQVFFRYQDEDLGWLVRRSLVSGQQERITPWPNGIPGTNSLAVSEDGKQILFSNTDRIDADIFLSDGV